MNKPLLSLVIPAYNEGKNIPFICNRLRNLLLNRLDVEVIFVNNGSTDHSIDVFQNELMAMNSRVFKLVNIPRNCGYGFGIKKGLESANGQFLAWTHADMQTDPGDALLALDQVIKKENPACFLVKGKRMQRGVLDLFFTFGMSIVTFIILNVWISDINAQPKLFHRDFFVKMKEMPDDFSLDLYCLYLAKKEGLSFINQPVIFNKRMHGEAKGGGCFLGKAKLIMRTLLYIIKLRRDLLCN